MVQNRVTIQAEKGLHMRPAGVLARAMSKYESEVLLIFQDKRVNAKSLLNIIGAGIRQGSEVEIRCEGREALDEALQVLNERMAV